MRTTTKEAAIFYGIVLSLSIGIALFLAPVIGHASLLIVMMTPLVGVLAMKLLVTREGWRKDGWGDLGLFSAGLKSGPMALLAPVGVLTFSYGLVWLLGIAGFGITDGYFDAWPAIALNVALAFVYCFGEEIGWRGYLVPKLMPLGHRKAWLISGLMQAIWHTPFMIFTVLYHGDGNAWLTIPLFITSLTVAGILFGYLRTVSGSVWPAVIAHWSLNICWAFFTDFTTNKNTLALEYLAGESGVLSVGAVIVLAVVLLRRYETETYGRQLVAA